MAAHVRKVAQPERDRAVGALVMAFAEDPFIRWMYPEARGYLTNFPAVVNAFGGQAFTAGVAMQVDGFTGAALWIPPGLEPGGDALVELLRATIDAERLPDLLAVLDQMDEHHPGYEHWYLPWFGVDSVAQGRGLGSILMTKCLAVVDREHLPAYLDSTNPRNVPFYQRHGFEVTGERQAGGSPPMFSMLRPAQV